MFVGHLLRISKEFPTVLGYKVSRIDKMDSYNLHTIYKHYNTSYNQIFYTSFTYSISNKNKSYII